MDFNYIEEICESYFINNDLYRKLGDKKANNLQNEISNEIKTFMRELRENDLHFYEQIYDQPRSQQRKILYNYLDSIIVTEHSELFENNDPIFELFAEVGIVALTAGVLSGIIKAIPGGFKRKMGSRTMRALEGITSTFSEIAKTLITDRNRNIKFRAAIIKKNAEECYKKECKVDPEDLGLKAHFSVRKTEEEPRDFEEKKAACLRDCYLQHLIDTIALLLEVYFACLKRTGEFDKIQQINTSEKLQKIVTGTSLSRHCESYFSDIKDAFDNFHELLEFLYPHDRQSQGYWMDQLRDKLFDAKNKIQQQNQAQVPKR